MRVRGFAAFAMLCFVATGTAPAATAPASPKPIRHLVYAFTWGTTTDREIQSGAFNTDSSGITDATGGSQDRGTITVDVTREQPDRGLILTVSEQARGRRSAQPTTCVVYGNTNVICDPNGKINEEEMVLLRYLGPTFVDPTQLDPKRHWQERQVTPEETSVSDFTISQMANDTMEIDVTRTVTGTGPRPFTKDTNGTLVYAFSRTIPTAVSEYTIERDQRGNSFDTVKSQTVLQLQSDSLAAKP